MCSSDLAILASKCLSWSFRFEKNEFDSLFPKIRLDEFKKLPIKKTDKFAQIPFVHLVDYVIYQKQTPSVSAQIGHYFEQIIDGMVCELYFGEEVVSKQIDILGLVTADLADFPAFDTLTEREKQTHLDNLYQKWTTNGSAIQSRLGLMRERSPDVLGVILGGQ